MKIGDIIYFGNDIGIISDITTPYVHIRFTDGKIKKYGGRELKRISYSRPQYAPKRLIEEDIQKPEKKRKYEGIYDIYNKVENEDDSEEDDSDEDDSEEDDSEEDDSIFDDLSDFSEEEEEGLHILLVCSLSNSALNCMKIHNLLQTLLQRKISNKDKLYLINPNPEFKNPLSRVTKEAVEKFNSIFNKSDYIPKEKEEWKWIPEENIIRSSLNCDTDISTLTGHPYDIIILDDCVMYRKEDKEKISPFFNRKCVNKFDISCLEWLDKILKDEGQLLVSANIKLFYDGNGNEVNEILNEKYGKSELLSIKWEFPIYIHNLYYHLWNN